MSAIAVFGTRIRDSYIPRLGLPTRRVAHRVCTARRGRSMNTRHATPNTRDEHSAAYFRCIRPRITRRLFRFYLE